MPFIADDHSNSNVEAITKRVADAEGVHVCELPPLYQAIDPELVESLPAEARLTIPYHGYTVRVHGDGTVRLQETEAD